MPLEGQWERQNMPLRPATRRERRVLFGVLGALAVAVVAIVVAIVVTSGSSSAGCISVTGTYSTGGATLRACGADARRFCRQEAARGDALARQVQAQCRRAGYARSG